jgi:hypothetical protein
LTDPDGSTDRAATRAPELALLSRHRLLFYEPLLAQRLLIAADRVDGPADTTTAAP